MKTNLGTFWRDQPDAESWAKVCTSGLNEMLVCILGDGINVRLRLPTAETVQKQMAANLDVQGSVAVSCLGLSKQELSLEIPLPYHGVFVQRREEASAPGLAVWNSWLGERVGFRYFSRPAGKDVYWRVGLPGGSYVQALCGKPIDAQLRRLLPKRLRVLPRSDEWPAFLKPSSKLMGIIDVPGQGGRNVSDEFWKTVSGLATKNFSDNKCGLTDEDDLNHRVLVTFPVWLKARLAEVLIGSILKVANGERTKVLEAFGREQPIGISLAQDLWEKLAEKKQINALAMHLRPPGWLRNPTANGKNRFYPIQWIDPINPVDLAALLTEVRRYPMAHDVLEMLPAQYRQNHPSFRGCICPVQSPESELVGLSLHVASGASIDWDGKITPANLSQPQGELGFGAGLVPFFEHNDGVRCMMGAKNLRQAMPVAKRQAPAIQTGGEKAILEFVQPLIEVGACPESADQQGSLALGVDLLVAYMPWLGLNIDDAIVVGQQVVDGGFLDIAMAKKYRQSLKPGWVLTGVGHATTFKRLNNRWEIEGATLKPGDLIANFGLEGSEVQHKWELRYKDRSSAQLKNACFIRDKDWMEGVFEYELVKHIKLGMGDKLMGRHGNKGVVGAILPSDQMPRVPKKAGIPLELQGRPIDILLNPHGVISRMNLGQLLETHIGWLLHASVNAAQIVKKGAVADNKFGQPFLNAVDHSQVHHLLVKNGLDSFGRVKLVLPDGKETQSPVVIGFQHIVRLRHVPELKAQARRGGEGAVYSRNTGQAIHGRVVGGGQRAGEMEIWALAGHQAEHIIHELLGVKADSIKCRDLLETAETKQQTSPDAFAARLQDSLFALLIDIKKDREHVAFDFVTSEDARTRMGAAKFIQNSQALRDVVLSSFDCKSDKKGGCSFSILDGLRLAAEPPRGKSAFVSLKFEELLNQFGMIEGGALKQEGEGYVLRLNSNQTGKPIGSVKVEFVSKNDQVKAKIYADPQILSKGWPKSLECLPLYRQFPFEKNRNANAALVLQEFLKEGGRWRIGQMSVACPEHPSLPLRGKPPFAQEHRPVEGGFFDPRLFGSLVSAGTTTDDKHWAYIELPIEVPYPVKAFLGAEEEADVFLSKQGLKLQDLPAVKVVPVLPLRYRMPITLEASSKHDDLVSKGYIPLLKLCEQYKAADSETRPSLAKMFYSAVETLFKLLVGRLKGKEGLIRHDGLGRRVDRSARLVIVPNPELQWDQAGVPAAVLLELLGDELARWVEMKRASGDLENVLAESSVNRSHAELLEGWSWRKSARGQLHLEAGHRLMCRLLKENPDILIILNRQPSLHRDSVQAFQPVSLSPDKGDVIQLCPLVCKAFAADFDGDEMAIHVPLSKSARKEAARMLPSQNMFSLATRKVLASFEQDFVLGLYWATREESGFKERLIKILPGECCRKWISKTIVDQKSGADLLEHLASVHTKEAPSIIWKLSNLAYECCTSLGVSFGFYELAELSNQCSARAQASLDEFDAQSPDDVNKKLNQKIQAPMLGLLKRETAASKNFFTRPGMHFAAMALSGARGKKQVRQLIGARGFLSPGIAPFQETNKQFLISSSLVVGMTASESFWGAMNSRSSMCDKKLGTRQAGYLTRRLVTALWPLLVIEKDCGSEDDMRTPVSCRSEKGVCAACYGTMPGGDFPEIGFPAGLIAAQSIGERGTQLSMQSFHAGEKAFTIKTVTENLDGKIAKTFFTTSGGAGRFVATMMHDEKGEPKDPYGDLDAVHFLVLWRVIHRSPLKTLKSAIGSAGLMTRIGFEQQGKTLLKAACSRERGSLNEPFARVIFNLFGNGNIHHKGQRS